MSPDVAFANVPLLKQLNQTIEKNNAVATDLNTSLVKYTKQLVILTWIICGVAVLQLIVMIRK